MAYSRTPGIEIARLALHVPDRPGLALDLDMNFVRAHERK